MPANLGGDLKSQRGHVLGELRSGGRLLTRKLGMRVNVLVERHQAVVFRINSSLDGLDASRQDTFVALGLVGTCGSGCKDGGCDENTAKTEATGRVHGLFPVRCRLSVRDDAQISDFD